MPQFNPLQLMLPQTRMPVRRPGPEMANDPSELFGLQSKFEDEASQNALQALKAGQAGPASAWNAQAGRWGAQQGTTLNRMMPTPDELELQSAVKEGFGGSKLDPSPVVARNIYKRNMEQEIARQPIEQTRMEQQGATQRQNIASKGQENVAQINADSISDRYNNFNELAEMIQTSGGTLGGLTLPGRSGGGSIRMQTPARPFDDRGMLNQLAVIRGNMQKAGIQNPFQNFANPTTQDEANFVQGVNNLLGSTRFSPNLADDSAAKAHIAQILRDPTQSSKPLNELFAAPDDMSVPEADRATPDEWYALVNFFTKIRGY